MMRSHDIRYLTREGCRNIWQNRFMALASVGVLISCLLLTGFAYMAFVNIEHLFQSAYEQNVVAVYLEPGIGAENAEQIGTRIAELDNVAKTTFVSKQESLERYGEDLPPEVYESMQGEDNPLPDTYIVSLKDLAIFDTTLDSIRMISGVEDISYDGEIAATLTKIRHLVMGVGGVVILVLLVVSLFIIANTIKLTVYNRRLEIYIMKSVGATDSFIRFPFMVEGVILGFVSGLLGYGLLYVLYDRLVKGFSLGVLASFVPFGAVWSRMLLGFLVSGILVGMCGSVISMNRHLKMEGSLRQ